MAADGRAEGMAEHSLGAWLREAGPHDPEAPSSDPEEGADERRPRRRRLGVLAAVAAVPWALFVITVAWPGGSDPALPPDAPEGEEPLATTGSQGPATGEGDAGLASAGDASPDRADWGGFPAAQPRGGSLPAGLAAIAAAAVRIEVSQPPTEGVRARHVDLAVAEDAEPVGDLWVVRVLAVLLEGSADGWTDTVARRYAVPVRVTEDGEPLLAGAPWPLPGPAVARREAADWAVTAQPRDGVLEALEAAGFAEARDLVTEDAEQSPLLRAAFTASDPEGRHVVWLLADPDPRVLGLAPVPRDDTDRRP